MKFRKIILLTLMMLGIFTVPSFAQPKELVPIFMGEVLEVEHDKEQENIRILTRGYIKGCEIYKEEILALVNTDTKILKNMCIDDENIKEENNLNYTTLGVEQGDTVFMVLSEVMTKSIPPQVVAKAIQVSKK